MIQSTLTLKVTTAQVVETSVTVNDDRLSPIQDYVHPEKKDNITNVHWFSKQSHQIVNW